MAILREYRGHYPRIGEGVYLADDVVLVGDVTIADRASVWWGAVLRGDRGSIHLGEGSNVQEGSLLHATEGLSTTWIGPDVTIGHHAVVHGARVERGCLIGMKATLLDLAVIGEFSVVAAGSVVAERMPVEPDSLVAGVPAKFKRRLEAAARQVRLDHAAEYRELAAHYLASEAGR